MQTGQAEGAGQQGRKAKNFVEHATEKISRQTVQTDGEDKTEKEINMQTGQAEGAGQQGRKAKNLCR
jgi:hypothetical protein